MPDPNVPPPTPTAQTTPDPGTSYQGTIPENVTPPAAAQPTTPVVAPTSVIPTTPTPTPAPQASQTPQTTPAPAAPATLSPNNDQGKPKTRGEWFASILKHVTPSQPVITTNPDGTQTVRNVATPASLGKTLIAGALAGMMTPTTYRSGAFGPIADTQATAANAFAAGQAKGKEISEAPQKLSDEMMARKLNAVKANTDAMHNYASMQQAQFAAQKEGAEAEAAQAKNWKDITDQNQATVLASADEYDDNRSTPDAPKARLTSGMTMEELLKSPFKDKMTSQLMIQDGLRSEVDPATGRTHMVPTWTVLNPDVTIKLNQASVDRAAKINPGFNTLWQDTKGNVRLNLGQYVAITHQINSVDHAEDLLQSVADSKDPDLMKLGIQGNVEGRLASVVKKNPSAMKSLLEFESGSAHGGSTADQLNRLLMSDGGDAIFKALGTNRDAVAKYVHDVQDKRTSEMALAKEGGMGEKAPMAQPQVDGMIQAIDTNSDLTADDKKLIHAQIPPADKDGVVRMTQGQGAKVDAMAREMITTNKNNAEKVLLSQGDPAQMQKTASNIIEGDINNITKVASLRGNARTNLVNALHDEAVARQLDPTDYSEAAIAAKDNAVTSYNAAGKIGQQIASFRTFLGHEAEAYDANEAWTRTNSPLLNKPLSWIAKNASNDPNYIRLKAALGNPAKEYMSFLNANRAEHESDIALMDTVLDPNSTPLAIHTALTELMKTADFRLGSLGKGFQATVGTNFTGLLDPSSKATLDKYLGGKATSPALAVPLPKGWQDGKAQPLTNKDIARAYYRAAGNDQAAAFALAKKNGWLIQ